MIVPLALFRSSAPVPIALYTCATSPNVEPIVAVSLAKIPVPLVLMADPEIPYVAPLPYDAQARIPAPLGLSDCP